MPPKNIHILGVDPGGTTAWARITVPRGSLFGGEPPQIIDWDYDEIYGNEIYQVNELSQIVREIQSLDYLVGPAVVMEDFDFGGTQSRDKEVYSPVRIAAMCRYAHSLGKFGDATLTLQSRTIAKQTMTDERLKRWRMYVSKSDHVRDAIRHALTGLRRARNSESFRDSLWNPRNCRI